MDTDKMKLSSGNGVVPRSDHRKQSMMPTIGFRAYSLVKCSGTILLVKPTGEMYWPNWTMKGTTYLKSRYFTFKADNHNPAPIAAQNANNTNSGKPTIDQLTTCPYQAMRKTRMTNDIAKSMKLTTTALAGIVNLGK